jgi:hypothetical protein
MSKQMLHAVSHVAAMAKVTLSIPAPAHVEED